MTAEQICKLWVLAVIVGLAFPASAADHREAPLIEEDIGPTVGAKGASSDVDKAMGVLPPYQKPGQVMSPARTKAIAEIDRFYKTYKAEKLDDPDIAEFLHGLRQKLIQEFPHGDVMALVFLVMREGLKEMNEDKKYFLKKLGEYNAMGLALADYIKGTGPPKRSAGKGIIAQEKPAEFKPGARTGAPGAKVGQAPDDQLPGTSAIDIDKALLGESLDLGAGLPTLPTATQGGVALRGGNVMQQLGDDGQRPGSIAAKGASPPLGVSPPGGLGGAASQGIRKPMDSSQPMIQQMQMPPSIAPAGKALQGLKGPPTVHKVKPYRALQK